MAIQTAFKLESEMLDDLKELSKDGRPMVWHVRKAIANYLDGSKSPIENPIAVVKSPTAKPKVPAVISPAKSYTADAVITELNTMAGTKYKFSAASRKDIAARLNDGFTFDECQMVIRKKCAEWLGTDMAKYLRPQTLFQASKFEGYLNQIVTTGKGGNHAPRKLSLAEQSELESRTVFAMCEAEEAGYSSVEAHESALRSQVGLESGRDTRGQQLHGELLTLVSENGEASR